MAEKPVTLREPGGPAAGMLCPVCRVDLVMADKQGVEIDYCPKCRGIWLDRGEIDKIIERSLAQEAPRAAAPYPDPAPPPYPGGYRGGDSHGGHGGFGGHGGGGHHGSSGSYGKHGRRSWLRDLFD